MLTSRQREPKHIRPKNKTQPRKYLSLRQILDELKNEQQDIRIHGWNSLLENSRCLNQMYDIWRFPGDSEFPEFYSKLLDIKNQKELEVAVIGLIPYTFVKDLDPPELSEKILDFLIPQINYNETILLFCIYIAIIYTPNIPQYFNMLFQITNLFLKIRNKKSVMAFRWLFTFCSPSDAASHLKDAIFCMQVVSELNSQQYFKQTSRVIFERLYKVEPELSYIFKADCVEIAKRVFPKSIPYITSLSKDFELASVHFHFDDIRLNWNVPAQARGTRAYGSFLLVVEEMVKWGVAVRRIDFHRYMNLLKAAIKRCGECWDIVYDNIYSNRNIYLNYYTAFYRKKKRILKKQRRAEAADKEYRLNEFL